MSMSEFGFPESHVEFPSNPPAIHGETVAGRAAEVRSQLEAISKRSNSLAFDTAALLAESKEHRYWEDDFESFGEYTQEVAGIKERAALYLVRIIQVSEQLGLPRTRIEHIEVSKLREIFSLDPDGVFVNNEEMRSEPLHEHIARLLVECDPTRTTPALSVEQVKAECKRLKGLVDGNDLVSMTKAKVTADCKANVTDPAVALAKRNIGSTRRDNEGDAVEPSDGAAWENIAQQYLLDPNNYPEGEAPQLTEGSDEEPEYRRNEEPGE
jgi:hypothetical protein